MYTLEELQEEEEQAVELLSLPPEILLHILTFLDIPDLSTITKTSHTLRHLGTDPLLHMHRLRSARTHLSHTLPTRPALSALPSTIYLTPRQATTRALSRNLVSLRLKRRLQTRPDIPTLVERGVLPAPCCSKIAPALVGNVVRLERERVRDCVAEGVRRMGEREEERGEGRRLRVRELCRRYRGVQERGEERWGRGRRVREDPPRAKVLALRRFWERMAKGERVVVGM